MASKIEKELTPEEVVELLDSLAKTPGGFTLATIQAEVKKRGVKISTTGATTFRDGALHPYLEKLRTNRQKSEMLAGAMTAGDETGFLATGRTMLAETVVDFLMTDKPEPKQYSSLAMTLQMLSSANQGDKMTVAKLREFEAKDEARAAEKAKLEKRKTALVKKGGLSEEAIALMDEALGLS